jgi:predicted outer membrane protein
MRHSTCAAAIVSALFMGSSLAQTAPTPAVTNADTQAFVTQAARATMLDLGSAKEVEKKSRDPAYQTYAKQAIADDSRIEDGLKSFAQGAGANLPDGLDDERSAALKDLQSSDGAQLEQKFRAAQIGGIRQAIQIFQDFGRTERDPRMKAFIETAAATFRSRLEAASRLPSVTSAPQG